MIHVYRGLPQQDITRKLLFRTLVSVLVATFVGIIGCSSSTDATVDSSLESLPSPTATSQPQSFGIFSEPAPSTPIPDTDRPLSPDSTTAITDTEASPIPGTTPSSPTEATVFSPAATATIPPTPTATPQPWVSLPGIQKREDIYLENIVESTPVLFNDRLITVSVGRPHGTRMLIHDMISGELIIQIPWTYDMASAMVVDDRLYLFGSSDHDVLGGHIAMTHLDAEYNRSDDFVIIPGRPAESIFNVSVAEAEEGFVMAYEIFREDLAGFSFRFARSQDLLTWSEVGDVVNEDIYSAAPTIRYLNGWYYVLYLRKVVEGYVTNIGRTQDFIEFDWFDGNEKYDRFTQVMSSFNYADEGINNSDVDLVEFNNKVYFTYANGDQQYWHDLKLAEYDGTLQQFFAEFWPE